MPARGWPGSTIAPRCPVISTNGQNWSSSSRGSSITPATDGLFRKYRIVFVDGRAYACHLAIADRWDIWYLNAGMSQSAAKRLEEETFMRDFDVDFARRHRAALDGLAGTIGLDYFTIDCAETGNGSLLVFEADNTAIVHDMDPVDIFPYKPPQMRKIFDAFAAMLARHAAAREERAA